MRKEKLPNDSPRFRSLRSTFQYDWTPKVEHLREAFHPDKLARYNVEFLGTFFLVFFIKLSSGLSDEHSQFAIGFTLMVLVYKYGYISGGHYNPAVTVGILVRGGVESFPTNDYGQIIMYLVSQMTGGLIGGLIGYAIGGHKTCDVYTQLIAPYNSTQGFFAEFFCTLWLVTTVLHCGTFQKGNEFYGIAIGCSLLVSAISISTITGCAINPAVWFGTTLSSYICKGKQQAKYFWVYWLAEFLGAIVGAYTFRYFEWALSYDDNNNNINITRESKGNVLVIDNDDKEEKDDIELNHPHASKSQTTGQQLNNDIENA